MVVQIALEVKGYISRGIESCTVEKYEGWLSGLHSLSGTIGTMSRGFKTLFMFNAAEHEILNAHKYKYIK